MTLAEEVPTRPAVAAVAAAIPKAQLAAATPLPAAADDQAQVTEEAPTR